MQLDPPPTGDPGPSTLRHKTLSAYYSRLVTLETLLVNVPDVLLHSDPREYRDLLLRTVCAPRDGTEVFPPTGHTEGSQHDAIERVLREMKGRLDVLLLGSDKSHSGPSAVFAKSGIVYLNTGTPASALRSKSWQILRTRLGDVGFRHLLLTTSLFLPLSNSCYQQLSGPPIHDLYDPKRHVKAPVPAAGKKRKRAPGEKEKPRPPAVTPKTGSATKLYINRQRIYYGRPPRGPHGKILYGLPSSHILNRGRGASHCTTTPPDAVCTELLVDIFCNRHSSAAGDTAAQSKRTLGMVGAVHELLVRHSTLDYGAHLLRCMDRLDDVDMVAYPPLEDEESRPRLDWIRSAPAKAKGAAASPLPPLQPVSQSMVNRFLTSVLRDLLSPHLAGSQYNLDLILQNARKLVRAKTYEPISVHSLLQGLRINDFTWLAAGKGARVPPHEAAKRRELVELFVRWLFDQFIVPLLRASFYATETVTTRYETVYYAHSAWSSAVEPHLRQLEASFLEELDEEQQQCAANGPLGVSSVRLIPKPNGFRPIVNLGKRRTKTKGSSKGNTPNEILRDVHQILTFEKNRKRDQLGTCLFGTNEVFGPVQSLKRELVGADCKLTKLWFVKMDITAAFDTIKQAKLLEVVGKLLDQREGYCLLMYSLLLPPASKASQGTARRLFKSRAAITDSSLATFGKHAQSVAEPLRNAVLVDLFRRKEITREACMNLLRLHIQQNTWQVGDKCFRQKTGIPQGSVISSLLCSFFYSALEAEHLKFTRRRGTRLLRYIDDFLLITDDFDVARRFVGVMSKGFPEYGAFVSPAKTLLSFELASNGVVAPVAALEADETCYFPYCGFLINTATLDFGIDHARFTSAPTRQSFALRFNQRPGGNFVGWLSRQLENRNHVAFLDTDHSSLDTVHVNVFVNFALTAMKVPHYFDGAPLDARRAKLVHEWLCLAADYTYTAGRARVRHAARGDQHEHFAVARRAFVHIAKSAFFRVLSRKASRLLLVVALLKRDLDAHPMSSLNGAIARGWSYVKHARF